MEGAKSGGMDATLASPDMDLVPFYQEGTEQESAEVEMKDPVGFHLRAYRKLGAVYRTILKGKSTLFFSGLDANDFVWRSTDLWTYREIAAAFREQLGDDHVTALDGAHHRQKRTVLKGAFDMGPSMRFLPQFNTIFHEEMAKAPALGEVELVHFWAKAICKAHTQTVCQTVITEDVLEKVVTWEKLFISGLLMGEERHAFYADPFYKEVKATALKLLGEMIDERLADPKKYDDNYTPVFQARKEVTVGELDRDILIDDIYFILLAGIENTARLMCICLAATLKNPAWFAELRAELDGWDGQDVMALSRLPKLKATIMEAQRYYPLVFFNFRQAAQNFEYKGFPVAAGQFITHAQSTCQFLEEMYADPLEFKPQRFVEDGRFVAKTNGFFGGGTHICLGRNYTMLQTPIALAQMLKYYTFEFVGDPAGPEMPAGSALKSLLVKVSARAS